MRRWPWSSSLWAWSGGWWRSERSPCPPAPLQGRRPHLQGPETDLEEENQPNSFFYKRKDHSWLPEAPSSRVGGFHSVVPSRFPSGCRLPRRLAATPTRGGGIPCRKNSGLRGGPTATRGPTSVGRVPFAAALAEQTLLRHPGGMVGEDGWSPASCCRDRRPESKTWKMKLPLPVERREGATFLQS